MQNSFPRMRRLEAAGWRLEATACAILSWSSSIRFRAALARGRGVQGQRTSQASVPSLPEDGSGQRGKCSPGDSFLLGPQQSPRPMPHTHPPRPQMTQVAKTGLLPTKPPWVERQ